jgi:hypothetical protein
VFCPPPPPPEPNEVADEPTLVFPPEASTHNCPFPAPVPPSPPEDGPPPENAPPPPPEHTTVIPDKEEKFTEVKLESIFVNV